MDMDSISDNLLVQSQKGGFKPFVAPRWKLKASTVRETSIAERGDPGRTKTIPVSSFFAKGTNSSLAQCHRVTHQCLSLAMFLSFKVCTQAAHPWHQRQLAPKRPASIADANHRVPSNHITATAPEHHATAPQPSEQRPPPIP